MPNLSSFDLVSLLSCTQEMSSFLLLPLFCIVTLANILTITKCHLISLDSNVTELIQQYDQLKKNFGDTALFREFNEKYGYEIDFLKFKTENKLRYNQKTGWNKSFFPIVKTIWVTDKKVYNKEKKKFGYYKNIQVGWTMGESKSRQPSCRYCGKALFEPRAKTCSATCRKLYHRVLKKGKDLYGFDLTKNNHILIKPVMYSHYYTESGIFQEHKIKDRIEFREISFSINGKRHYLTTKSRTL